MAVFSTGSELVAPGTEPAPGQIPDSNSIMLAGLVREHGGEAVIVGSVADDCDDLRQRLTRSARDVDLVLTAGGISAGAYEVVVASDRRMALMREYEQPHAIDPHELLAELDPRVDWVLVEGFKHSDLPKVEVWRPAAPGQPERPVHYGGDDHVVAVATDAAQLPRPTALPVLNLRDPEAVAQWMLEQGARFDYLPQAVEACE